MSLSLHQRQRVPIARRAGRDWRGPRSHVFGHSEQDSRNERQRVFLVLPPAGVPPVRRLPRRDGAAELSGAALVPAHRVGRRPPGRGLQRSLRDVTSRTTLNPRLPNLDPRTSILDPHLSTLNSQLSTLMPNP